jgi:hypothetical protein
METRRRIVQIKKCSKCEKEKPVKQFYKHARSPDGLSVWCKECRREYFNDNKDVFYVRNRKHREALKRQIFEFYSNGLIKCACCGETTYEFLTIDHIKNGGAKHRKEFGNSIKIWINLRKQNFPSGFQVLCWNCNVAKYQYGICPHQKLKGEAIGTSDCTISSRLA